MQRMAHSCSIHPLRHHLVRGIAVEGHNLDAHDNFGAGKPVVRDLGQRLRRPTVARAAPGSDPEVLNFEIAGYCLRETRQILFRSNCLSPGFLLHRTSFFWSSDIVFDEEQNLATAVSQSQKKGDTLIRRGDTSEI